MRSVIAVAAVLALSACGGQMGTPDELATASSAEELAAAQPPDALAEALAEKTTEQAETDDAFLALDNLNTSGTDSALAASAVEEMVVPAPGGSGPCTNAPATQIAVHPSYPTPAWGHAIWLRCGRWYSSRSQGWGYRKLVAKGRWNVWFQGMIGVTLAGDASPTFIPDPRGGAGMWMFQTKLFKNCPNPYRFKVFASRKDISTQSGVQMQGVLNAYQDFRN